MLDVIDTMIRGGIQRSIAIFSTSALSFFFVIPFVNEYKMNKVAQRLHEVRVRRGDDD